jgi:iron complex transport system substrate-binding protein
MKNKFLKLGLVLLLAAVTLAACAPAAATTTPLPPSSPVTITDQAGRTVTFTSAPQRIISLTPSNTEILFALGMGDKVVGVTDYCDYPPEAKSKPSIGGYSTPSLETIVSLSPDLIVADSIHETTIVPQLESQGLKVIVLDANSIDETLAAIAMMGKACGVKENAANIINSMEARIKAVTDKTAGLTKEQRPSTCYLVWHDPLMVAGLGTLQDELIDKAGGWDLVGALSSQRGYGTISLETLIDANPAVLMAGTGHGDDTDLTIQYARTETRLSGTDARKNSRIYGVDADIATRAGPRIVDALEAFAHDLHPELFP